MTLLSDFRDAARAHGTLGADEALDLGGAFRAVRDMPWGEPSRLDPATAVEEWRGTGREKHLLLRAILDALGYETNLLAVTCEFEPESAPWLPPALLEQVRAAPVPDVHLLLRVQTNRMLEEWMTLDATWPLAAGGLGLPVNEGVTPGRDHHLACDPVEVYHLPEEDEDDEPGMLLGLVERILRDHVGDAPGASDRRARFMTALAAWLAEATATR